MYFDIAMRELIDHPTCRLRRDVWLPGRCLLLREGILTFVGPLERDAEYWIWTAAEIQADDWKVLYEWQMDDRPDVWVWRL